jgi:predicted 3-demethylubiquinone-9 3-methyltransferase (glyoxalase superfamily)
MPALQKISPCLWFPGTAEEAARFYASIFPNSSIGEIARYGEAGMEFHGQAPGSVMTIEFVLEGQSFTGLNGPPIFHFTEAVSFQIYCDTQQEIDHFWDKLSAGGAAEAQQCGWLKDKFGLSWQVVPKMMSQLMQGPAEKCQRAMTAMLQMKKLDIAALQKAYDGG